MPNSQIFELKTLLSLLNKEKYLDVQDTDVNVVVQFMYGFADPEEDLYPFIVDKVIDYIAERYPRLVEAASMLVDNKYFDRQRYNSMINLFRMNHALAPMELALA